MSELTDGLTWLEEREGLALDAYRLMARRASWAARMPHLPDSRAIEADMGALMNAIKAHEEVKP